MFLKIMLSYFAYAVVTAFTPGPNNIVALYAISQNGWKKGKNVLIGITAGFLCVMLLCAIFCYELNQYIPSISKVLKYVGVVYILWLAIHVARSKPDAEGSSKVTFLEGFLLQFVNIKIILYAITIFTGYVLPADASLASILQHVASLTVIGTAGCLTWAFAGGVLQKFLQKHYKPFNYAMALILLYCAVSLL